MSSADRPSRPAPAFSMRRRMPYCPGAGRQRQVRSARVAGVRVVELAAGVRPARHLDHAAAGVDAVVAAEGVGLEVARVHGRRDGTPKLPPLTIAGVRPPRRPAASAVRLRRIAPPRGGAASPREPAQTLDANAVVHEAYLRLCQALYPPANYPVRLRRCMEQRGFPAPRPATDETPRLLRR